MTSIRTRSSDRSGTALTLSRRVFCVGLASIPVAGIAFSRAAHAADPLDNARNAGTAGERHDGYAVTRDGAGGDVQQLVDSINQKRRAFYEKKAAEQNVSINAIQEIYAKAIYDKAPAGWWFLTNSGWVQK